MKQSDIEEFKAILYVIAGIYAYSYDIMVLAVVLWILAGISLLAGCIIAYYEQKLKKLKALLADKP